MNRISELRKEKKLNMSEMAKEMGLPYTTYVGYEKGERELKSKMLQKFADHFGVSTDYILGITDEKTPTTESDGSVNDSPVDELEGYAKMLFTQLNISNKIEAINELQSLLRQQQVQDDRSESD